MIKEHTVLSGRYEIERPLGRGGMAEVYLGTDRLLSRTVAIKVLPSWLADDPTSRARFRREARAAARLNHPNVVGIYDTGTDDGIEYIVMEYVEGRTLEEVLAAEGPLPPRRAAEIASAVAAALSYAHRAELVHRDVKPGNIMLTSTGTAKVMDFGIARALSSDTLTQTGRVFGTAAYLSPEQARGGPVDARSDIYSLGVVLFEMLTGRPPFQAETAMAVAHKHLSEEPPAPSAVGSGVPPAMDAVVLRALAKDPADRHRDAEALVRDLRPIAWAASASGSGTTQPIVRTGTDVLPVAAGTPPPPGARPPRPRRRWPGLLAAVLLAVVAVALLATLLDPNEPAVAPPAASSPTTTAPPETAPADPVAAAVAALREAVAEGVSAGEVSGEAAGKILEHVEKAVAEFEEGDVEHAVEELDKAGEEVFKALDEGRITSEERAAEIAQAIEDLEAAMLSVAPAPAEEEGNEEGEDGPGGGNGSDHGKGKGLDKQD